MMPSTSIYALDSVMYLNKELGAQVDTEEKTVTEYTIVSSNDELWGSAGQNSWYVLESDITLSNRPEVSGNVNLILTNGKILTADKGITLEDGSTLTVYAQSDLQNVMGGIVAKSDNGNAGIGGRVGESGEVDQNGKPGNAAGKLYWKGGKLDITAKKATCIGGGNGGEGGDASTFELGGGTGGAGATANSVYFYGGVTTLNGLVGIGGGTGGTGGDVCYNTSKQGGNGGRGDNVYFYDGLVKINASNGACIGGGNGGTGGTTQESNGANGGNGGDSFSVEYKGGTVELYSLSGACISGGRGGNPGEGAEHFGNFGRAGSLLYTIEAESQPFMMLGMDESSATKVNYTYNHYNLENYMLIIGNNSHLPKLVKGKAATETEDGWNDYYQCRNTDCNKIYSDIDCQNEITDLQAWKNGDGKIEKLSNQHVHALRHIDGKLATCTADGWKDYYQCSDDACCKYFEDSACANEISDIVLWISGSGKISKTAHVWGSGVSSDSCVACGFVKPSALAELRTQNEQLQYIINNMSGDSVQLASENAALEWKINELSANAFELGQQLSEKMQTIVNLNNTIAELNTQIEELTEQLNEISGGGVSIGELNAAKEEVEQLKGEKQKLQLQIDKYVAFLTPPTKLIEKVKTADNKMTISWTKEKDATHYQIYYKRSGASAKSVTVAGKNTSKTIKNLKSGKKYTVKIRGIKKDNKTITYGTWSTTKTVRIK